MKTKCAVCKEETEKFKKISKPFYKNWRNVCLDCYRKAQSKINVKAEDLE
jgi:hypothetical protein